MKKVLLIVLALLVLSACRGVLVKDGVLRDTIFSVEETENGNFRVWFTHDDIAGYCTTDRELGQRAMTMLNEHNGEVVASFRWINKNSDEWSFWHKSGCGSITTSSESSTAMFMLTELKPVKARD